MASYSKSAGKRAMKIQEVMLRSMAKKIMWSEAAKIIGISDPGICGGGENGEKS